MYKKKKTKQSWYKINKTEKAFITATTTPSSRRPTDKTQRAKDDWKLSQTKVLQSEV